MSEDATLSGSYRVFLSHSSADRWIACQMARLIERQGRRLGIRVFLDEKDIDGGQSIPDLIRTSLRGCHEFLILLSQTSATRPWVLIELGAAWGLEKPIVAIIDKVTPEAMPDIIAHAKAIDLNAFDDYLAQLLKRARGPRK